ncbi:DUF3592 domain-containing protein [Photobacterium nomapromontoriensis]|uniref:DUF3592 domain-containing protein n=1 Tax=Photobacterium nomapromontoriensis TaxID=2910237 RepID=UPI003D0E4086
MFSFAVGLAVYVANEFHASFSWPVTKGRVVDSWLENVHNPSNSDERFKVGIEYAYSVDGESYYKDSKSDLNGAVNIYDLDEAEALIAEFPRGQVVEVHYKPSNHNTAVLKPTVHIFILVAAVIFSLVLVLVLYLIYREMTE